MRCLWIAVIATLFVGCSDQQEGAQQTFRNFFYLSLSSSRIGTRHAYPLLSKRSKAVFENRFQQARAQLPSRAELSVEDFFVFRHGKYGNRIISIASRRVSSERSELTVEFSQGKATVPMVREDGVWKVDLASDLGRASP